MKVVYNATDEQQAVIKQFHDPSHILSIIAGPGCGKTYTLACRLLHLLSLGISPSEILVLSLTNMATNNIKSNLMETLNFMEDHETAKQFVDSLNISTIDAFSYQLVNSINPINILDPRDLISFDSSHKKKPDFQDYLQDLWEVFNNSSSELEFSSKSDYLLNASKKSLIWEEFTRLSAQGLRIFKMVRRDSINAIKNNKISLPYKVVLIDEFQDVNDDILEFVDCLLNKNIHITVAGDPNQSIFKFLGSENSHKKLERLITKNSKFLKELKINQSFRCDKGILEFAENFANNKIIDTPTVLLNSFDSEDKKYSFICEEIKRLNQSEKISLNDIMILGRTNNEVTNFQKASDFYGLKTQRTSQLPTWLLNSITTYFIYFCKIINNPKRYQFELLAAMKLITGVTTRTISGIITKSRNHDSYWDYLMNVKRHSSKKIEKFFKVINEIHEEYINTDNSLITPEKILNDVLRVIVDTDCEFWFLGGSKNLNNIENSLQNQQLMEIYNALYLAKESLNDKEMSLLQWFIDGYTEYMTTAKTFKFPTDINNNSLTISTIHSAKGLQSPIVFMMNRLAKPNELFNKEEKRVKYVAATRAQNVLYWCDSHHGYVLEKHKDFVINSLENRPIMKMNKELVNTVLRRGFSMLQKCNYRL